MLMFSSDISSDSNLKYDREEKSILSKFKICSSSFQKPSGKCCFIRKVKVFMIFVRVPSFLCRLVSGK